MSLQCLDDADEMTPEAPQCDPAARLGQLMLLTPGSIFTTRDFSRKLNVKQGDLNDAVVLLQDAEAMSAQKVGRSRVLFKAPPQHTGNIKDKLERSGITSNGQDYTRTCGAANTKENESFAHVSPYTEGLLERRE